MATFPAGLFAPINPNSATDNLNTVSVPHDTQHQNINNEVVAVETKLGIDSSSVTTTIDYLLKNSASIDPGHHHTTATLDSLASSKVTGLPAFPTGTIVGTTDTQTLTNKTISTGSAMAESLLTLTDITTNNVSTTNHGFAPKSPNIVTQYLDGTGAYSVPANDGWNFVSDTFTYASANSFTIAGVDRTLVYTKGTRVKFTNNAITYYGVVGSSSFATNTTVTLIANNDYSIANLAITNPFYSYQVNPQGYPTWFNYTPTYTGWSVNPDESHRFKADGKTVIINAAMNSGGGTSNSIAASISLPVVASSISISDTINPLKCLDNGAEQSSYGETVIGASSASIVFRKTPGNSNSWTASGGKAYWGVFIYEF